jgi:NitT/TauT family transport system ATP-binding protein
MTSPLLTLSGVGKTFPNGVEALTGVDLTIRQGEFVALLGASGCGKSTLLRIIAGLSEPSSGSLSWSRPLETKSGRLGFVFQDATLMPWTSVADNVYLPLRLAGMSRTEAQPRIGEALAAVELTEFAEAYPRELSGGMRMRVSIARALVTRPDILLLDEPFAALDEPTRFKLNEDLLKLWRTRGLTVIFVTHSVFESVFLAQRVIVMKRRPGRIASEIAIPLPPERDAALRMSGDFGATCRAVSDTLARATAAEAEAA